VTKSFAGKSIVAATVALFALVLTMQSSSAGLGLGEARVNSFLGQALDVRIALLQPSPEALDSLTVEIASREDHVRLGVPADALALGLGVQLDRSTEPPALHVRSARPVFDPFVQILISARWANGRMLREYTVFLDPSTVAVAPPIRRLDPVAPVTPSAERDIMEQLPATAAADPAAPAAPTEPAAPVASLAERTPPAPPISPSPRASTPLERVGPVRSGQTLWSIAEAWRPDPALSMNQVMLAILEQNPQAFMDDNINRLRRGAELIMPDVESIRAIPLDEALRRIREQNEDWEARRRVPAEAPVVAASATDAGGPTPADPQSEPDAGADLRAELPAAAAGGDAEDLDPAAISPPTESEPMQQSLPDAPRLVLTTAEESPMTDLQFIAVERGRLAEQLELLVQELRGDGMGSDEIAAGIDQIRQAIDSADVGGLMVASEGLAQLEQQVRELRVEREQAAAEAVPAIEAVSVSPAPAVTAQRSGWLQPLLAAFATLAVLVLALVMLMRHQSRRREQAAAQASAPVVPRSATETTDDKLKGLYRLAEREDREGFGSALGAFHADLKTTEDPRWKEAVVLARALVPGHPLLLNRMEDQAPQPAHGNGEDANRELMELLDDTDERDQVESFGPEFAAEETTDFTGLAEEQDADDDPADLARLGNRLDPDAPPNIDPDRIALGEPEANALVAPNEPAKPVWEQASGEGPLDLDFEFSSREEAGDAVGEDDGAESGDKQSERFSSQPELGSETARAGTEGEDHDWFKLEPSDDEALSSANVEDPDGPDAQKDALSDDDVEVKLDLARAYLSMNDADSARALLEEIVAEGTESHRQQARQLLDDLK